MLPNELLSLFLTKTQIQKLTILYQMNSSSSSLTRIEEKLAVNRRQAKELTNSLIEDFMDNKSDYTYLPDLHVKDERLFFDRALSDQEFVALLNTIKVFYVSSSGLYQVLLYVLERRSFRLIDLATSLAYSKSYTYKLLGKLKDFFESLATDVTLSKKNETIICLSGDESSIRILHYFAISVVSKGKKWLFQTLDEQTVLDQQNQKNSKMYQRLSPINRVRMMHITTVYELAKQNGARLAPLPGEVCEIGQLFYETFTGEVPLLTDGPPMNANGSPSIEELHLFFFSNYFTQELQTKKEKQFLGKEVQKLTTNPIVKNVLQLVRELKKTFLISNETSDLLFYDLCNKIIVVHYLGLYRYMLFDTVPIFSGKTEKTIEKALIKTFSIYRNQRSFPNFIFTVTQIILGYLTLSIERPQKLYIEFYHRPEYKSLIENALSITYNRRMIQLVECYKEADIIISDTCVSNEKKKFFYFRDIFDQHSWQELGNYLTHVINEHVVESMELSPWNPPVHESLK